MENQDTGSLTAEESAYFESRGETPVTPEPVIQEPVAPVVEPTGQDRDEKGKFVPHGALHAEREEHKKTKQELQRLAEKQAVLDDRWNTLLAAHQAQKPAEPVDNDPEPDQNVDIFAHNAWLARRTARLEAKLTERDQQEAQSRQISQQDAAIWDTWQQDTASFSQTQSDFNEARDFLSNMRITQLSALGRLNPQFSTEQGRIQQINSELKEIIVAAKQNGISPAQYIYELAASYGYTPKAADPNPVPAQINTELPVQLRQVQDAQERSRTVAAAPGGAGADPLTAEAIAAMPSAEFAKWLEKGDFRKIAGG